MRILGIEKNNCYFKKPCISSYNYKSSVSDPNPFAIWLDIF